MDYPTIQPDNLDLLERNGLIAKVIAKKRKLSTFILSSSSSFASAATVVNSHTHSPSEFSAFHFAEHTETVEIPVKLESKETYEFIGVTPEKAAGLCEFFSNFPTAEPDFEGDFLELVLLYIDTVCDHCILSGTSKN